MPLKQRNLGFSQPLCGALFQPHASTASEPVHQLAACLWPHSSQQQQQQHPAPTAAAVTHTIAAAVEHLKSQGNAALAAGDYDAAETAYMEALQIDGDNVKVLLNLAALRLKQSDGEAALRCCDEVLAQQQQQQQQQQQLGLDQIMKARLR